MEIWELILFLALHVCSSYMEFSIANLHIIFPHLSRLFSLTKKEFGRVTSWLHALKPRMYNSSPTCQLALLLL